MVVKKEDQPRCFQVPTQIYKHIQKTQWSLLCLDPEDTTVAGYIKQKEEHFYQSLSPAG
jgi:hypothetical protein